MIRLVQYNVCRFHVGTKSNVTKICKALKALDPPPSIITLNEVDLALYPDSLKELSKSLGMHHYFFGHVRGTYGNAILSRWPIVSTHESCLDGGSNIEWPPKSGNLKRIIRGLMFCTVEVPLSPSSTLPLSFAVTHLDHIAEKERVAQMKHAVNLLKKASRHHVLVGDLNALVRAHYSVKHWEKLEERNQERGWAPPDDAMCLELLREKGYVDCFDSANSLEGEGGCGLPSTLTAHVANPLYRIDYAWASPAFMNAFKVSNAKVARQVELSDHYPVIWDFQAKKQTSPKQASTPCSL